MKKFCAIILFGFHVCIVGQIVEYSHMLIMYWHYAILRIYDIDNKRAIYVYIMDS